nr:HAMP domain-containing histidine kinase [Lachnospiraceae bacterium]
MEMAEKNRELTKFKESIEKKDRERNEMSERIDAMQLQENELRAQIASLETEVETLNQESVEKLDIMAKTGAHELLPPLTPGHDEKEQVNIIKIAEKARDELMIDARQVNLHINISSANDILQTNADPNRLKAVFRNIIDNSIKYMKRTGSLVITFSAVGEDIFIALKDTGAGLSEEETRHIFEMNYQGSNRVGGNGLGLAQARCIVEYYGGTIYAKSTKGKGMGIYIQLPSKVKTI